jgi:hypothetical protein
MLLYFVFLFTVLEQSLRLSSIRGVAYVRPKDFVASQSIHLYGCMDETLPDISYSYVTQSYATVTTKLGPLVLFVTISIQPKTKHPVPQISISEVTL